MGDLAQQVVREPESETPEQFAHRVSQLAAAYVVLFFASLTGIGLLVWKAQLFVGLSQRSNVETLTLAFLVVFFGYIALLSAGGAYGAARIGYYALLARLGKSADDVERRKQRALGPPGPGSPAVGLSAILELEDQPGQPFRVEIADKAGSMGALQVDGAHLRHIETRKDGSNSLLAFFTHQVNRVLSERGRPAELSIVEWKSTNDETTSQYVGLVHFARNLERQLGATELWPKVTLTRAACEELERRLSAVCPSLRNEAFLPHWEYEAEHKLPIIPEPLGIISLSRTEKRADPLATMGCAVLVVVATVVVLAMFIKFPPWVPGA